MDLGEPPALPYMALPEPPVLPVPILEVPDAHVPSYKPIVVPPSALKAPPGVKGKPLEGKQPNTPTTLSLIHISEPTRPERSRMPSSA